MAIGYQSSTNISESFEQVHKELLCLALTLLKLVELKGWFFG